MLTKDQAEFLQRSLTSLLSDQDLTLEFGDTVLDAEILEDCEFDRVEVIQEPGGYTVHVFGTWGIISGLDKWSFRPEGLVVRGNKTSGDYPKMAIWEYQNDDPADCEKFEKIQSEWEHLQQRLAAQVPGYE